MHDHLAGSEQKAPQLIQIAAAPYQKPHDHHTQYLVGLDVGSTTVKATVVDAATDQILWQDYQRHETKQPEKTLEFLRRMEAEVGIDRHNTRMFMTGSGGNGIADQIGAKFVQEVTAVSLAVEKLHPEVYSVIELGGQDAKIIVFKDDDETGRKKKIPSMNDKCAGGTGAVIDKINAKLKIPTAELALQAYHGIKLHKVAGKCGVFAETDINGLQKVGTPPDELMASLFEAIVLQNLSVLTRGHTLRPHVLLLGGPNSFIKGMREAWQANIPRMWQERKVAVPDGAKPEDLIKVPNNAQYFAALGAIEFGKGEDDCVGCYRGYDQLLYYIEFGRQEEKAKSGAKGLVSKDGELDGFKEAYRRKKFTPATFQKGQTVGGFIGIDGGSTSTKAVLLDDRGDILCKAYQLSNGNPIQDTIEMFENLRGQVEAQNAKLEVLGVATTGYAKDILKDVLHADVALVETVAHTESALKFYEDPHVHNVKYVDPVLNFADRKLFAHQMLQAWQPILGLSQEENDRAIEVGYKALEDYESGIRRKACQVLDQLEREDRIGIVMLGRPYHHDPGLNHEIMEEFQKLGYPIFSQNTLPLDEDMLERLFSDEVRAGVISHALDITDAWKNSYSCSTNHKVWAAKFTARHPNLVALEISSFKCGHDAPIYGVIEGIIEQSGTPYFCFKDLDENKPSGSIKIRVETIDYFLRRYRDEVIRKRKAAEEIDAQLATLENELRGSAALGSVEQAELQEMAGD